MEISIVRKHFDGRYRFLWVWLYDSLMSGYLHALLFVIPAFFGIRWEVRFNWIECHWHHWPIYPPKPGENSMNSMLYELALRNQKNYDRAKGISREYPVI